MIILQQTRGLLSSNDQLALDLPLAETKSITARVGPTPVFTHSSTGTYFGPLVGFGAFVFYTTTLQGGRAYWEYISIEGDQYSFEYSGDGWQLRVLLADAEDPYYVNATEGSEWRPDQANWSGSGISVTTSSTYGIVRAAINEPRFEHDPLTGVCGGLLLEQSRTNLILRSEDFASASWAKGGGSFSSVANVDVDGSANSELFSEDGTTGNHRIFQAFTTVIGTVYTLSVFLKFNGRAQVLLENRSITGNPSARFNIQNGTIEGVSSLLTATIQAYPNGWYRCSITGTSTLVGGNYLIIGSLAGATNYTGINGPAFYVYGAQVEAGATATSYIPTTAGTAVRSQDLYTITGAAFTGMYNQTEGSIFCAVTSVGATTATSGVYGIQAPTRSNGAVSAEFNVTNFRSSVTSTAFAFQATFHTTASRNVLVKNAVALRTDDFANSCNGNIATDTAGTLPAIMDRFVIGATGNNTGPQIGNNIFSSIKYYSKRLPNAKLQALTT
jgi:hypothetical protein